MTRWCAAVLGVLLVAAAASGDPYRDQQWWLADVGADTGIGQVVAIVDSGVDLDHPDLVDRFVRRDGDVVAVDLVTDADGAATSDVDDPSGHGTMVAGLVGATADNGVGIAGVAPGVLLLPVRVLDEAGVGTATRVAAGVRWAVANGADIVNVSLEATEGADIGLLDAPLVRTAFREARADGVNVVVAAGNRSGRVGDVPAIVVGAHDRDGRPLPTSTSGPDVVHAPGVDMVSTWCRGTPVCSDGDPTYGLGTGTSFAAPVVAGLLARARAAGLDGEAAEEAIRAATVPMDDPDDGRRLDTDALALPGRIEVRPAVGPTDGIRPFAADLPRDRVPTVLVTVAVVVAAVLLRRRLAGSGDT